MKITVNNRTLEVSGERTLLEELRDAGCDIPSLCYAGKAKHEASCMVCMVRDVATSQMLPSCSTFPTEGMQLDTESEDVKNMRRMSLELLLSDHRADCEAPCVVVCPAKIDVARVILHYDRGQMDKAKAVLLETASADQLPCVGCKASCEKACRRGTLDTAVSVRAIIEEVAKYKAVIPNTASSAAKVQHSFSSKLGRYSEAEKEWLKEVYNQPSRCLHCACEGKDKCKLREYASQAGIKSSRYGVSSHQMVKEQQHVSGRLYYEPAKCVRCGLCVYNSQNGFTFQHRGFDMQVLIPEENKAHIDEHLADLCPTGALFLRQD